MENEGFVDAFRVVFPDEVAKPGFTWTPSTEPTDPEDHHDRIDFVFARAPKLEVLSAGIVGEKAPEADIVVTPWPSDHRAVDGDGEVLGIGDWGLGFGLSKRPSNP